MAETRAVDGTFDAEHQPLVVLEIVANMGAADHSLGSVAKRTRRQLIEGARYPGPGNGVAAPGVTDLAANIEAGPGEDRNWRRRSGAGSAAKAVPARVAAAANAPAQAREAL